MSHISQSVATTIPRIAIVTGASSLRGIGRAIALRLAEDGLDVAVNDLASNEADLLKVSDEIRALGRKSVAFCSDVSTEEGVKSLIAHVVKELGGLDVMVANAGVHAPKPLLETSLDDWNRVMDINAGGVMLQYKYAALQMIKQDRGGRIIGASSVAGKRGHPSAAAYTASKFAVRGLTQATAQELAKYNITVNAYAPGLIDTAIFGDDHTIFDMYAKFAPSAGPEVVANHVSYLARTDSHFITGQTTSICGGVFFD